MTFDNADIVKILEPSIKNRFQDFLSQDFEDFIGRIYKDLGFDVEQTSYSGDYGADLIVTKYNIKTAIQIKRYQMSNKVGVQDINQIIGAKNYYKCDEAAVITTSSYTKQGEKLAKETDIELLQWEDLISIFSKLYWNNKDYFTFYSEQNIDSIIRESTYLKLTFDKTETFVQLKGGQYSTIIYLIVENTSKENIKLTFSLPTLITKGYKQIDAIYNLSTEFTGGLVYAGCKVKIGYIFPYDNVQQISEGDKIISKFFESVGDSNEIEKTYFSIYGDSNQRVNLNLFDSRINDLETDNQTLESELLFDKEKFNSFELEIQKLKTKLSKQSRNQIFLIIGIITILLLLVFLRS